jgi:ABC-type antimicrobial peptide transport system permease subunit
VIPAFSQAMKLYAAVLATGNLAAAIITLLFVIALAALFPSLRASRLDPAISLRQE